MITRYKIVKRNNEEILYLYIDYNYEFAKIKSNNKLSLEEYIKGYIKKNKILFKGTTITLIVGGIVAGNLYLTNYSTDNNYIDKNNIDNNNQVIEKNIFAEKNNSKESIKEESKSSNENTNSNNKEENSIKEKNSSQETKTYSTDTQTNQNTNTNQDTNTFMEVPEVIDTNTYITIRRSNGEYQTLELEEYIIGVVGYEMPASFNVEALKSQAVIARTYALKSTLRGITLTDNNSTQGYKSNAELQSLWGSSYNTYYNKIRNAVISTKGEYLTYNGTYIDAVYHSTSNGRTESSSNVWGNYYPYLVSVDSPYDICNSSFQKETFLSYQEISNKLGLSVDSNTNFNVLGYTSGNRINSIEINNQILTGVELRNKLALRSADIEIIKQENGIIFITKGYGHGVGLSQYGANGYANNGYSYKDILRHYYTGVTISKL